MKVNVLYFAVFRERLGIDSETLTLSEPATVGDAISLLSERHSAVHALAGHFRVAVNQDMAQNHTELTDGDEIALIPPVAGGNDRLATIVDTPPSLDRLMNHVMTRDMGGLVTFTGVVRQKSQGRDVERLEYEAYGDMANKVLTELCDQVEREIPGTRIAVEHRVGKLDVGDIAVAIACAAPHRAEAFRGARAMIDRLKEKAPIWKKEIGPTGEEWVGLGP